MLDETIMIFEVQLSLEYRYQFLYQYSLKWDGSSY